MKRSVALLASFLVSACNDAALQSKRSPAASSSASVATGPSAPLPVEGPDERLTPLRLRTYAVAIEGTIAHVGTEAGVSVVDLEHVDQPKPLAHLTLPDSVNNLTLISGGRLAVAVGPSGIAIADASGARGGSIKLLNQIPWTPVQRGGCNAAWKAVSSGPNRLFAACGTGGIGEIDITRPQAPQVRRVLPVSDYVRDVAVLDETSGVPQDKASKSLVAAAAGLSGLMIVDFPAAGEPRVKATLPTTGETRAVAVRGGMAYLAEGPAGLRIVDLKDPAKPTVVGSARPDSTDMIRGLVVGASTAWLCAGESGIIGLDITHPSTPTHVGTYDPQRAVNRAALMGDLLVAANDADGLLILDTTTPASPRVLHPAPAAPH